MDKKQYLGSLYNLARPECTLTAAISVILYICYTNSGPSMLDKGQGAIRAGHLKNLRLWQLSFVQGPVFWLVNQERDLAMEKSSEPTRLQIVNPFGAQIRLNRCQLILDHEDHLGRKHGQPFEVSNGVSFYLLLPSPDIYLKMYRLTVTRHATDQTVHTKWHPCTARWIGCARPSFLCIKVKWPMVFRTSNQ